MDKLKGNNCHKRKRVSDFLQNIDIVTTSLQFNKKLICI